MKRRTLLTGAALGAVAVPAAVTSMSAWASSRTDYQIAVTEQASGRLLIFNRDDEWTEDTIQWSWEAGSDRAWRNLDDVKFRNTAKFGEVVLVAASYGNIAILDRREDGAKVLWSHKTGDSPHSIERIPDLGVIVVACASTGVKVFAPTAVSDPGTLGLVQRVGLTQAHGVLWDPSLQLLWVIADKLVRAYQVTGSYRKTRLKATDREVALPAMGHDLQPDYSDGDKLLVTDSHGVYEIDVNTMKLTRIKEGVRFKSISRHPNGETMWQQADGKGDRPHDSPTIHFDDDSRTLKGSRIYKSRIAVPNFEPF